ncbi:MAG: hypothetical protein CUN55_04855 [Phototrophicales bacterium]|nr:MAG: hypothetical protein CUN55_04855 [Phototrophicales bacterium]
MKTWALSYRLLLLFLLAIVLLGCEASTNSTDDSKVRLEVVVDGTRKTYTYDRIASVGQLLAAYEIEVSPLDKVNPPQFTQISDGMVITIVRVTEEEKCTDSTLAYEVKRFNTTNLEPGVVEVAEPGKNGIERICYRVVYEDGVEVSSTIRERIILEPAIDRIEYVGVEDNVDPVPIIGTLSYIASGQAYIMQTSSSSRRPLTTEGGLDGRVFDLSSDGRQLLFTRQTSDANDEPFANELWVILDTRSNPPTPIQTELRDVLTAAWRPGVPYTFAYSSATPANIFSGWSAYNDLHIIRLDGQTGNIINVDTIIESNLTGLFAAWGTRFAWAPDGQKMAYAKADGIGLVDFAAGVLLPPTISFPHFESSIASNWVWQPTISWSQDSEWIVTTVHGPPYAEESPTNSIIFDLAVWRVSDNFIIDRLLPEVGIWANPIYSPIAVDPEFGFKDFQIAYLQARDPYNSVSTEYDLVVADRDGSNPRIVFPGTSLRGIRPIDGEGEFVWSPDGEQIAIVYQNDLWLLNVRSGIAQRVTNEGPVRAPRWVG